MPFRSQTWRKGEADDRTLHPLFPAETAFLRAEHRVFSNAKNHRRAPLVPLVVPTVNPSHLRAIPAQRAAHNLERGFLVCNSNCAVIGLAIPLAALEARFGPVAEASVVTLQAVSGAGYPGVPSMDMVDNVVPYIPGEEDKLEAEARKILGSLREDAPSASASAAASTSEPTPLFAPRADLRISATCTRVPVLDGHTACVSLRFAARPPPPPAAARAALAEYVSGAQSMGCPSAPDRAILVTEEADRPQPRLDRDAGGGYAVTVGRVRADESGVWDLMFVALSHNSEFFLFSFSPPLLPPRWSGVPPCSDDERGLWADDSVFFFLAAIIGAAGASILNAEVAVLMGYA